MTTLTPTDARLLLSDLAELRKTYGGQIHWFEQRGGWFPIGAVFAGSLVDLGPVAVAR